MNILFYGNCQTWSVMRTLQLPHYFTVHHVECWRETIDQQEFTDIIKKCDIIVTQPIQDNYRDTTYLSTSYILQHKKSDCRVILFDSCYFNFYYFDLTYTTFNNEMLRKPIDYHYHGMMECYRTSKPISYYIDHYVNNVDLKTSEELEEIATNSLTELCNRFIVNKEKYESDTVHVISIHEYVKSNYKEKLLFYSMNHPTKYVIQFVCEEINRILHLENTINYDIDDLANPKCLIYQCISKNVHFDIHQQPVLTLNRTDVNQITQLYYDTYAEIEFK